MQQGHLPLSRSTSYTSLLLLALAQVTFEGERGESTTKFRIASNFTRKSPKKQIAPAPSNLPPARAICLAIKKKQLTWKL
jgi:hypothetical protein